MAAITVFFIAQLPQLVMDNSVESYFLEDDESLKIYNDFRADFGNDMFVFMKINFAEIKHRISCVMVLPINPGPYKPRIQIWKSHPTLEMQL